MILFYKTGEMFVDIKQGYMVYVIVRDTNSVFNKRLAVSLSSRKKQLCTLQCLISIGSYLF